jgi:hypothetical protein
MAFRSLMLGAVVAANSGGPEQRMDSELYLQSRREWDERDGDLVFSLRRI